MSIENQLERLNANIEALVGAIAANTSVAASITNTAAPAAAAPAAEKPAKPRKPKTEAPAAETTAVAAPVANALGVSAEQVAEDLKKAPPAAEAPQANDDPFGDLNAGETAAPTYTIDDVREVALKLRDATDMDKAKAFIAKFGVDSIKYLPEDKFADFITKAKAAIAAAAL